MKIYRVSGVVKLDDVMIYTEVEADSEDEAIAQVMEVYENSKVIDVADYDLDTVCIDSGRLSELD